MDEAKGIEPTWKGLSKEELRKLDEEERREEELERQRKLEGPKAANA